MTNTLILYIYSEKERENEKTIRPNLYYFRPIRCNDRYIVH